MIKCPECGEDAWLEDVVDGYIWVICPNCIMEEN